MINLLAPLVGGIVNKFVDRIPDGNARAEAKEQLEQELVTAANSAMMAQIELNKAEAQHKSLFVAGWRPFIGWTCGAAILWTFLLQPMAQWCISMWGPPGTVLPALNTSYLMEMVLGMLGISSLRTVEKVKNVAR